MSITIFLLEDHELVRTGLRLILEREADFSIVGEAESGEDAIPLIRQLRPDVLLCDMHLPGISGLDVTERLCKSGNGPHVIMVSVLEDGPLPRRVIDAGAMAYVSKNGDPRELVRAVREVMRGRRFLSSSIAQQMALSKVQEQGSPFDQLSPKEVQVAMLLVQGYRQEDIAQLLLLSAKTINTHKSRLFTKLDVNDVVALARLAAQYGLMDPAKPI